MRKKTAKMLKAAAKMIFVKEIVPMYQAIVSNETYDDEQKAVLLSRLKTERQLYKGLKREYTRYGS